MKHGVVPLTPLCRKMVETAANVVNEVHTKQRLCSNEVQDQIPSMHLQHAMHIVHLSIFSY